VNACQKAADRRLDMLMTGRTLAGTEDIHHGFQKSYALERLWKGLHLLQKSAQIYHQPWAWHSQ
jgi:hypothetical protein